MTIDLLEQHRLREREAITKFKLEIARALANVDEAGQACVKAISESMDQYEAARLARDIAWRGEPIVQTPQSQEPAQEPAPSSGAPETPATDEAPVDAGSEAARAIAKEIFGDAPHNFEA